MLPSIRSGVPSRVNYRLRRLLPCALLLVSIGLASSHCAQAQALSGGSPTTASDGQFPAGVVPVFRGPNLSLATTSQHDSASGWSSLLTPALAYRFGDHLSINASFPVFASVNTYQQTAPAQGGTAATYGFVNHHFLLGDSAAAAEFSMNPAGFEDTLGATIGIPTGDPKLGLGAGHSTFEISNHIDHSIGDYITPEVEFALDNSPNLTLRRVRKSYTDTGLSAHLQGGLGISLPRNINLSVDGYDDLPLGTQTVTGKKKKATVAAQSTDGADNGILNTLDIPVSGHLTVSGFYNRSFYDGTDIAGVTLTFMLRAAPRHDTAH